jgi:integrase
MAIKDPMTWNAKDKRWHKGYRGKRYAVSPNQLGTYKSKEASREAMKQWWKTKQDEIDKAIGEAKHPNNLLWAYNNAKQQWRLLAKWQRRYGAEGQWGNPSGIEQAEKCEKMVDYLDTLLKTSDPPFPLPKQLYDPLLEYVEGLNSEEEATHRLIWYDRMQLIMKDDELETAPPKEKTIRAYIDKYLELKKTQAQASGKIGTYFYSTDPWLQVFRKWVEPTAPMENINEALWERWCVYLIGKVNAGGLSPVTMKNYKNGAKAFIIHCWRNRYINDLPRNLNDKNLSITIPLKTKVLFSIPDIKTIMKQANERQRLYILLALNCGMYPSDIGRLRQSEVDWNNGRIIRQRGKTRDRSANVPCVDYLLWKETFSLLKKHKAETSEYALVNENGGCLYFQEDGKSKSSAVECSWKRLMKKLPEIDKPLKSLRKTPASLLENHAEYGRYAEYFLGEAPKSIATKHYIQPSKEQFDKAMQWLRTELGIGQKAKKSNPNRKGGNPAPDKTD